MELNLNAVYSFEPSLSPFYQPELSAVDVAEIAEQLAGEYDDGEF